MRNVEKVLGAVCLGTLLVGAGCQSDPSEESPPLGQLQSQVRMDQGDLGFLLEQIQMAEAHAAGVPMSSLLVSELLPFGLRTVNGSYNNVLPGQELFGTADRRFPRMAPPLLIAGEPATFDPDGPGPLQAGDPSSYTQTSGLVFDSRPRTISNLIVDQTTNNPVTAVVAERNPGTVPNVDGAGTFFFPNVAPDVGLSAPYNSWFTLFGQFFDHGLDLVRKGGSGTVFIPLQSDDPLYDPASSTNFMVLTRATNDPGNDLILGTADDLHEHTNLTTPFVDQNQTYTSHPSHQVFLREYALNGSGRPVSTGRLLDGARGGIANWREVKAQASALLGIRLTDEADLLDLPLLATDPYGKFLPGPGGFPQVVTSSGLVEGNPLAPIATTAATRSGHGFLDDIAHNAAPNAGLAPDDDTVAGAVPQQPGTFDNELLDQHFCTGDGRGNENIGLTAVHTIFHREHNRLVDHVKQVAQDSGSPAFVAQWLLPGANQGDGIQEGEWNGERLFQAARFGTEMQYQHLVFEEFARKVQPEVNLFIGYDSTIDPALMAEFAHTVYRFGHSMLTETVARTNADGTLNDLGLIEAFLNPQAFTASGPTDLESAASIIRGMTRQVGNELDEFVTSALRNNLLGLPLDLATINLARGRDTGVPSLNNARRLFFAETSNSALLPYESWTDFSFGIRHPESLVNFVAAYGTHPTVTGATLMVDKRAAANLIVNGGVGEPPDRLDFLNSTGPWATAETGLNQVEFWIGGLAEKQMIFGGLLGSTFNYVFETQMEKLQDGDRLYYLTRTAGLNFLTQLEENSFSELIMRNTSLRHLPLDSFSRPAFVFELANLGLSGPVLDDPATPEWDESALLIRMPDGTLRYTGLEHLVMGGTSGNDRMRGSEGDDTFWGDEGNDRIEGGDGVDSINGGPGDDILTDLFGVDNIKGGEGHDAISGGPGLGDLLFGGAGNDFIVAGADPKESFGGQGNDFIVAGDSFDTVFGGEGDDWIEGGDQADLLQGDNGDPFQISKIVGNDVIMGQGGNDDYDTETGDDIMVSDEGVERHEGMLGFDWVTYKFNSTPVDADLDFTGLRPPNAEELRDRFDDVEALSGWNLDDKLRGDSLTTVELAAVQAESGHNQALNNAQQISLISGLQELLGPGVSSFSAGNILLGGAGSDLIEGRGGDDIIDGDAWLNVYLSIRDGLDNQIATAETMQAVLQNKSGALVGTPGTLTLASAIFAGTLNPGQLRIVREIVWSPSGASVDTALFSDVLDNYDIALELDGTVTVAHARGTLLDGTDRIRNVEDLQFSDTTVSVASLFALPADAVFALRAFAGDTQVALEWTTPPGTTLIRVFRSSACHAGSPMGSDGQVLIYEGLASGFTDTGLQNGTEYYYTVYARGPSGAFSLPTYCTAIPYVPVPPTDGGTNGGTDAGTNGGTDAGTNGGTDAGTNGGTDAGTNGTVDAGTNGIPDAGNHTPPKDPPGCGGCSTTTDSAVAWFGLLTLVHLARRRLRVR